MTVSSIRHTWYSRLVSSCLMVTFVTSMVITPKASYAGVMGLPNPGTMVNLSPSYVPLMITGLTVHPENPLLMDFIVSTGNSGLNKEEVKKESQRLIKYFLACLTIPENNQWVNLSPYEKQRIIPQDLGQTVLGQDMLAQDYLLKQLTASLIYPEKNLGKNFWDKVYARARQMYGTTQIPVNTFNKVWILPDTAKVYEHKDTVFVVKSHLTVMLDEDYLALEKNTPTRGHVPEGYVSPSTLPSDLGLTTKAPQVNHLGSEIVRQIILPAIEQEVNTGKNFAQLRQIYNSMILAFWFKNNLKQALLNQVYTDKSKVNGVNVDDPAIKEKIYKQYIQAYKKGVFNYIKEEVDQNSQETIPRKYFSGGLTAITSEQRATPAEFVGAVRSEPEGNDDEAVRVLLGKAGNAAMLNEEVVRKKIYPRLVELAVASGVTPVAYMENYIQTGHAEESNPHRFLELEKVLEENQIDSYSDQLLNQILTIVRQMVKALPETAQYADVLPDNYHGSAIKFGKEHSKFRVSLYAGKQDKFVISFLLPIKSKGAEDTEPTHMPRFIELEAVNEAAAKNVFQSLDENVQFWKSIARASIATTEKRDALMGKVVDAINAALIENPKASNTEAAMASLFIDPVKLHLRTSPHQKREKQVLFSFTDGRDLDISQTTKDEVTAILFTNSNGRTKEITRVTYADPIAWHPAASEPLALSPLPDWKEAIAQINQKQAAMTSETPDQQHIASVLAQQSALTVAINKASGPTGESGFQLDQRPSENTATSTGEEGSPRPDNTMVTDLSILEWKSPHGLSLQETLSKIIKEYDIRGFDGYDDLNFPSQMDPTLLRWIGRALGTATFESPVHGRSVSMEPGDAFIVGGDNGPSTDELVKKNEIEGLLDAGVDVIDLGTTISGHTYKAIELLRRQGGRFARIKGGSYTTRSHVEVGTNGIKPVVGGITLYGDMLKAVFKQIMSAQYRKAEKRGVLLTADSPEAQEIRALSKKLYFDSLRKRYAGLKGVVSTIGRKVAVNLNSGSAAVDPDYQEIIKELIGAESIETFLKAEPDSFARKGLADPSRADEKALGHPEANIVQYSKEHPDTLVFNFDLDVDRISVLEDGRLYLGDEEFYPVIEYQYRDGMNPYAKMMREEVPLSFDSRMKSEIFQLARYFGAKAGLHPKGHSKVKATMDVTLEEIAARRNMTPQQFLDANPDWRNAQPEYSLHMFLSNELGQNLDDGLDFMLFWLNLWGAIVKDRQKPGLTLAGYIQDFKTRGIIDDVKQLQEQRIPVNEDAKFKVMNLMRDQVVAAFNGRDDFEYFDNWKDSVKKSKPYTLVNVEGVYHLYTPDGEAFWGWSNTSPKISEGTQSATEEGRARLAQIVTALYIHARDTVAKELNISLAKIDPLETGPLYAIAGVPVIKARAIQDKKDPNKLSTDEKKAYTAAAANELEAKITTDFPTTESALNALKNNAMISATLNKGAVNVAEVDQEATGISDEDGNSFTIISDANVYIAPKKAVETSKAPIVLSNRNGIDASRNSAVNGGIDLNSRTLKLQSEGQKVDITFNPAMIAQFRRGDFSGVKIKVLDVIPVSLIPLLGLREDGEFEQLAKV